MKKIIFILALFVSFVANSQYTPPTGYTNINSRYDWLAGVFRALGLPAGGNAAFTTGQAQRAGSVYYDSTGVDAGLYVWSGSAWVGVQYTDADARSAISLTTTGTSGASTYTSATGVFNIPDYTTTASEGITKTGSDFTFGGTLTSNRQISWDYGNKTFQMNPSTGMGSDVQVESSDSIVNNPETDSEANTVAFTSRKIWKYPSYTSQYYRIANDFQVEYQIKDSVRLNSYGGDFGSAVRTDMVFTKMPGYSGRSVYVLGNQTLNDALPIHINYAYLGTSSTAGNYKYLRGYLTANQSMLYIAKTDTIENWIGFNNMAGFFDQSHVKFSADYAGGYFGSATVARVANPWGVFIWNARSKNYFAGSLALGDSIIDASALIDASSTTKGFLPPRMSAAQRVAIASPASGLIVFDLDSLSTFQYNGSAWQNLYNTGGGSGSGTVNSGTQYRLGYYATTGTAISEAAAITGDRALISDANGVPTHSATTATEIGHVSGVTSAIQTQLDAKISGSLTATRIPFATGANTLSDDAALTWDNTNKRMTVGDGTVNALLTMNMAAGNTTDGVRFQAGGATKFYLSPGSTQSDLYMVNHSFRVYVNGTGNLSFLVAGATGMTYNSSHATTGKHTFQTAGATRAIINNDGLNLAEQAEPSTPASGFTGIYAKSDGLIYGKDDAGVETRLSNYIPPKNINLSTPGSAENEFIFFTDVAITVTNTRAVLVGSSTPSVTYNIGFGTDRTSLTNVYTAGQTVTSTTTGTDASGVNDATIPANSWVILTTSAQSGTVTAINVSIAYTID